MAHGLLRSTLPHSAPMRRSDGTSPVTAQARQTGSISCGRIPLRIAARGGCSAMRTASAVRMPAVRLARMTSARRQRRLERVAQPDGQPDPVDPRVGDGRRDGQRIPVPGPDRGEPQFRRGDGKHAGPASDVDQRPRRQRQQQLQAATGRVVLPGPERHRRIDDDIHGVAVRSMPRWADPNASRHLDRLMELAHGRLPAGILIDPREFRMPDRCQQRAEPGGRTVGACGRHPELQADSLIVQRRLPAAGAEHRARRSKRHLRLRRRHDDAQPDELSGRRGGAGRRSLHPAGSPDRPRPRRAWPPPGGPPRFRRAAP